MPDRDDPLAAPLLYHAPGMAAITPRSRVYRTTSDDDLELDLYLPPDPALDRQPPVVIFIHGGPIPPDLPPATQWGVFRGYGALAAASGWAGVTFRHRFHSDDSNSDYDKLEQVDGDIAAAIASVREHAAELGVSPERILLWAFSGGGLFLARYLRERPTWLRGLAAFYALLDLRPLANDSERANTAAMARLARFSPAAALEESGAGAPPVLIARAGKDHPALNAGIDAFTRAALTANLTLDVLNHATGDHGFDTRNDVPRTHEIIAHTLAFIRERFA